MGRVAIVANVGAQGDSDTIECRILVNGVLKAAEISHEANAFAFRMLKAA